MAPLNDLINGITAALNLFKPGDKLSKWIDDKTENIERRLVQANPEIAKELLRLPFLPQSMRDILTGKPKPGHAVQLLALIPLLALPLLQFTNEFFVFLSRNMRELGNRTVPNELLPIPDIITAYYRGILTLDETKGHLVAHGYDGWHAETLVKNAVSLLSVEECIELELRGYMTTTETERRAFAQGFTAEDVEHKRKLREIIPSVSDLIPMQVRDAFNDEVIQAYELATGDYSQVTAWAAKQGLPGDWVKRYWTSHWYYPSPTMAAEMVQRLRNAPPEIRFTEEDYTRLLRINDYAPWFISRMLALTYTPLTRVDLRRFRQAGLIDEDRLKQGYRELGYNEENAELHAQFAELGASETEKDLTRTDVLNAYADGALSRADAGERLVLLGYDEREAEIYLSRVDLDAKKAAVKEEIAFIEQSVLTGDITPEAARGALGDLELTGKEIDRYLIKWERATRKKARMPSKADFDRFLKEGIIEEAEYIDALTLLGYGTKYIGYYVALIAAGTLPAEGEE